MSGVLYERTFDAGFVTSLYLDYEVGYGLLEPTAFRIINYQDTAFEGQPVSVFLSTDIFPSSAILAHWSVPAQVNGEGGCLSTFDILVCSLLQKLQTVMTDVLLATNISNPAAIAALTGAYTVGFTPPLSVLTALEAQQAAGAFDVSSATCVDMSTVLNMIDCPEGTVLLSRDQIVANCENIGISCPGNFGNGTDTECLCNPCKALCKSPLVFLGGTSCGCPNSGLLIGGNCVESYVIIVGCVVPGVSLALVIFFFYMRWLFKRSDKMWHIKPSGEKR